jgi:hypothetical protein
MQLTHCKQFKPPAQHTPQGVHILGVQPHGKHVLQGVQTLGVHSGNEHTLGVQGTGLHVGTHGAHVGIQDTLSIAQIAHDALLIVHTASIAQIASDAVEIASIASDPSTAAHNARLAPSVATAKPTPTTAPITQPPPP